MGDEALDGDGKGVDGGVPGPQMGGMPCPTAPETPKSLKPRPPRCWCGRPTRLGPKGNRYCPSCGRYRGRKAAPKPKKPVPKTKFRSSWWDRVVNWRTEKLRGVRWR
jgi:hypothetical protein